MTEFEKLALRILSILLEHIIGYRQLGTDPKEKIFKLIDDIEKFMEE